MKASLRFHSVRPRSSVRRAFCRTSPVGSSAFSSPLLTSRPSLDQRRRLHVGPYIESSCQAAQDAIVSLHSITGLSWSLTIPLVAVGVSILFRLPFVAHTQLLVHKRSKVAHVLQGWFMKEWREAARAKVPHDEMNKEVEKRAKSHTKRIYRALGLQQWKAVLTLLGVPFWLLSLEALRRLCGWNRWASATSAEPDTTPAVPLDVSRDVANTAHQLNPAAGLQTTAAADLPSSVAHMSSAAQNMDPTLTTEGVLWFTDLTAADPYYILPVGFIALTVINLIPMDEAARKALFGRLYPYLSMKPNTLPEAESTSPATTSPAKAVQVEGNWRIRLIRSFVVGSPLLLIWVAEFPAAMHLYTLTSVLTTMTMRSVLSRRYPAQKKVKTCKHREMPIIRPPLPKQD